MENFLMEQTIYHADPSWNDLFLWFYFMAINLKKLKRRSLEKILLKLHLAYLHRQDFSDKSVKIVIKKY